MRRPYAETATSVYDYPLSSRFDETDALVVFDRVFVPWERVFVYRDVALTQAQFYETPAHVLGNHQAQVRFASKAQFLAGVALRIAESIGVDKAPQPGPCSASSPATARWPRAGPRLGGRVRAR